MSKKDSIILADFDLTELPKVLEAANKRTATNEAKSFRRTVENWNEKPKFFVEVDATYGDISDYKVYTDSIIYKFVDEGTEPHTITPNGNYPLHFKEGYTPKTVRGKLGSSGSGEEYGNDVYTYQVEHSGIEARGFTEEIKSKAAERWQRAIDTEIKKYLDKKVGK